VSNFEAGDTAICVNDSNWGEGKYVIEGCRYTIEDAKYGCVQLENIGIMDDGTYFDDNRFKKVENMITVGDTVRCIKPDSIFDRGDEGEVRAVSKDRSDTYDIKVKCGAKLAWVNSDYFETVDSTGFDDGSFVEIEVDLPEDVLGTIKALANEYGLSEGTMVRYMLVDSIIEGRVGTND
jgi:hypothetical protein